MQSKNVKQSRIHRLFGIKVKSKLAAAYMDTAVKILICVVCGALFLTGIYGVIQKVVLPKTESSVTSMFAYEAADADNGGSGGLGGVDAPGVGTEYEMLDGADQTYDVNGATPLSFRSSAPVDTFQEVKVDKDTVDSSNYTVTEGSTIVTFTNEYAKTLASGDHTVEIISSNGSAEANFSIQLTTLTVKTWNGLSSFMGTCVWTDGENTYYSNEDLMTMENYQKVLNNGVWENKSWNGLGYFYGTNVWTDGENTYYSMGDSQYVLNGNTWETKTWNGLTSIFRSYIWTDGKNTYYSDGANQYVLNGNTWEAKIWNGLTNFDGQYVWNDGSNVYYSKGSNHYVLNGDTWESKTWNGLANFDPYYIWTDGSSVYYSSGTKQYVLNGDTWESKTWNGLTSFDGSDIWTDGENYYYSNGSDQYMFS